ncbi:hypothetical protein pipiens_008495 [Culex pipiens pipiens]|uniref:Uncharacterized protein n=1 Tax=Culex pipiens pipiens TaxID=38569 RepID=A0ABD1DJC1_CULPP
MCPTSTDSDSEQGSLEDFLEQCLAPCCWEIWKTTKTAKNLESISNELIRVDEQEDQLKKQIMDPLVLTRAVRSCFRSKRANCTLTARSLAPRGVWLQSQRDVNLERQYAPGLSPRHADQHEFRVSDLDVTINNLTINFCLQESIGKQLAAFHCSFSSPAERSDVFVRNESLRSRRPPPAKIGKRAPSPRSQRGIIVTPRVEYKSERSSLPIFVRPPELDTCCQTDLFLYIAPSSQYRDHQGCQVADRILGSVSYSLRVELKYGCVLPDGPATTPRTSVTLTTCLSLMLFAGSIRYVPENIICIEIVPHELLGINFLDRTLVCVRNRPESCCGQFRLQRTYNNNWTMAQSAAENGSRLNRPSGSWQTANRK